MVLDLSEKDENDFLLRLAKNELRLHHKLVAYLKKKAGHKHEVSTNNRTIADLVELVEKEEKLRQIAAEKKQKRLVNSDWNLLLKTRTFIGKKLLKLDQKEEAGNIRMP